MHQCVCVCVCMCARAYSYASESALCKLPHKMGSQVHKIYKIHQAQLLPMVEMHTMAHPAISSSANVLPIARCRAVGQKDAAGIQPTLSLGRFLG